MSSTNCCCVLLVFAVVGAVVWFLLHCSTENPAADKTDETTLPTPSLSTKAFIFVTSEDNQTVIEFDPSTKSLTKLQLSNYISGTYLSSSTQNDDFGAFIYMPETTNNVSLFDKKEKRVVASANLGFSYYDDSSFGISGDHILVLSYPNIGKCQTVTVLSPRENVVIESNITMKVCRRIAYCMASSASGDVYIFGGNDGHTTGPFQDVLASEKYSSESKTMETIADLPASIPAMTSPNCKTAEYNGNIMVCGGDASMNQGCYVYDIAGDEWETVGSFVNPRSFYELGVIGNDLFAIGGNQQNTIERYNRESKSWEVFMTEIDDFEASFITFSF